MVGYEVNHEVGKINYWFEFMHDLVLVAAGPRWELWWPKAAWLTLTPDEQTAVAARQRDLLATSDGKPQEINDNEQIPRPYHIGR